MASVKLRATSVRSLALCLLSLWVGWALLAFLLWPSRRLVERLPCLPVERVLWAPHVVTAAFGLVPALLRIDARGKLSHVAPAGRADAEAYAASHGLALEAHDGLTISPGVVDARVQLASPGRAWEGYAHGTRAAVAGGVTTVVDGPFGSLPPATDKHGLQLHMRAAATDALSAHVGFLAGLTPALARDALGLFALARVGPLGFYAVLSPMHEAAGAQPLEPEALRAAAEPIARIGLPLLVRAELASLEGVQRLQAAAVYEQEADKLDPLTHLRTRPAEWQADALGALAQLVGDVPKLRLHATDLARADEQTRAALARARELGGARFSADTAPHYLRFDALALRYGETRLKAEPAIGEESDRQGLWAQLAGGDIDVVTSAHAPCGAELRADGDFLSAWAGVSGVQFLLQVVWSEARLRGHTPLQLARWLSERPAALLGLLGRKGELRAGADADLLVWDPHMRVQPPHADFSRLGGSPYANVSMHGRVEQTVVGGVPAFVRGVHTGSHCGAVILAKHSAHTSSATWRG